MILQQLPFTLAGPIAAGFRNLAQALWTGIEAKLTDLFEAGRVKHLSPTGLMVVYADMPIRPNLSNEAKRLFIQNYDQMLERVATGPGLDLIGQALELSLCAHLQLRFSPMAVNYPWVAVRLWVNPVDATKLAQIDEFFKLMLPARCIPWRELIQYTPAAGFGAHFGEVFGA